MEAGAGNASICLEKIPVVYGCRRTFKRNNPLEAVLERFYDHVFLDGGINARGRSAGRLYPANANGCHCNFGQYGKHEGLIGMSGITL
jgi:hypothetical protein